MVQVWQQVKVIEEGHEHEGRVGVVLQVDIPRRLALVRLDAVDRPMGELRDYFPGADVGFDLSSLQVIGR